MKFTILAMMVASATAFQSTSLFGVVRTSSFALEAKHANDKAAKWAASKRPKKSRPSDINRKPVDHELHKMVKPAEYTIEDQDVPQEA